MNEKSYYLDMFSGIGGFALAAYNTGLRFNGHYFSEVDEFVVNLYKKRFPDAIALGDITEVDYGKLPKGNWLITGGFPCQPHSTLGKRGGATDKRDLWPECARAISSLQPRIALFENVPGLFSSNEGRFFNQVLSDISVAGYDAEWQIISAQEVGAPHKRKRIWIVAYPDRTRLYKIKNQKRIADKALQQKQSKRRIFPQFIDRDLYCRDGMLSDNFIARTNDGLPEELDRYKGIGNAIVPACAEEIMNYSAFDFWRV